MHAIPDHTIWKPDTVTKYPGVYNVIIILAHDFSEDQAIDDSDHCMFEGVSCVYFFAFL